MHGTTVVVSPGRLDRGQYALIDTWQQANDLPHNRPGNPVTGLEPLPTADDVPISIFYVAFRLICTDCLLIK